MKKIFRFVSAVSLIASFFACQKELEQDVKEEPVVEGVEINIITDGNIDPGLKTSVVDGEIPSVKWLSSDQLTIYEIVDDAVNATTTSTSTTLSEGDFVANFKATIPGADPSGTSYKYAAVYPATAVDKGNDFYRLTMPATQNLNDNNFSSDSDILISNVFDHGDSRVASDENINFSFRRVGTAVKLTLKGITADEKIKKVIITAPHYIAGRVKYVRETSSLVTDSWHYGSEHQNTITLNVDDLTATGTDVLWFRVLAAEKWASGEGLSIEVETDKANYYRNGRDGSHAVITLGKDIEFVDGGLTAFGVALGAYRVEKPVATNYTLVDSASSIVDGAEYIITNAAGDNAAAAFSSTYFGQTSVTADANVISITSEPVTVFTLEDAGSGKFYIKTDDDDYIGNPSKGSLTKGAKGADTYKWTVTEDDITNVGASTFQIMYNSGASRFSAYAGTMGAIKLYVNPVSLLPLGISFGDASYEFTVGSGEYLAFTGQAVTKTGGVSDERVVTYSIGSDASSIITSINSSTGAVVLSGNTGTATIKATVGGTDGVYKAGSTSYTITVNPESTYVSSITAAGDYNIKNLTVMAVNGRSIIAEDATGAVLIYAASAGHGIVVNDVITVNGSVISYHQVWEFSSPTITKTGTTTAIYPSPVTYDDAKFTSYSSSPVIEYATTTGVASSSGRSVTSDGGKVYNVYGDLSSVDGKLVIITGFVFGYNSSKVDFMLVGAPAIHPSVPSLVTDPANDSTIEWDDDEYGDGKAETITVTLNGLASGYTTEWTDSENAWSVNDDGNGTITVYPKAANGSTTTDKTLTITITHDDDALLTSTITLKQNKQGGGDVIVLSEEFDNNQTTDSNSAISTSTFSNFSGATSKAFKSQYGGIKFGNSSNAGYITSKSLDLSKAFTVSFTARKYGNDTGTIQVTVGGVTKSITPTSDDAPYSIDFDAATSTSTVKIGTSSKRGYIDNVVITRHD